MKILIVYYSRTGTTKKVAQKLQELLKADMEEIKETKDRAGVLGYIRSGKEALKEIIPKIEAAQKDAGAYDLVLIGTPVWAYNLASPVRAYLQAHKDKIKKAALFCTQASAGSERVLEKIVMLLKQQIGLMLTLTTDEVVKDKFSKKAEEFVNKIIAL